MDVARNSWSYRCKRSLEDVLRVVNYFRWVWVRVSSCVNGSESQNVVIQQGSLTLLVTFIVVDVVFRGWSSSGVLCETKIISRPTDHQWSLRSSKSCGVARWKV